MGGVQNLPKADVFDLIECLNCKGTGNQPEHLLILSESLLKLKRRRRKQEIRKRKRIQNEQDAYRRNHPDQFYTEGAPRRRLTCEIPLVETPPMTGRRLASSRSSAPSVARAGMLSAALLLGGYALARVIRVFRASRQERTLCKAGEIQPFS